MQTAIENTWLAALGWYSSQGIMSVLKLGLQNFLDNYEALRVMKWITTLSCIDESQNKRCLRLTDMMETKKIDDTNNN